MNPSSSTTGLSMLVHVAGQALQNWLQVNALNWPGPETVVAQLRGSCHLQQPDFEAAWHVRTRVRRPRHIQDRSLGPQPTSWSTDLAVCSPARSSPRRGSWACSCQATRTRRALPVGNRTQKLSSHSKPSPRRAARDPRHFGSARSTFVFRSDASTKNASILSSHSQHQDACSV